MTRPSYESLLSHSFVREVLHYDPETGFFTWKVNRMKGRRMAVIHRPAGSRAGCRTVNYAGYESIQIKGYGSPIRSHRLAWFWMTGEWPPEMIDHINGDRGDNRWSNLRLASRSENMRNRPRAKLSKRNFKGVDKSGDFWGATICVDRVHHNLGQYETEEAAAIAYNDAAKRLHGAFANLNDVDELHRGANVARAAQPGTMRHVYKMNHRKDLWIARVKREYIGSFRNPIEAGMAVIACGHSV